jgi:hypothetical protein
MTLLPKKGDFKDIRNYQPIPLVNTDYKIFTRIVNRRIMCFASNLINEFQLGFIPGRYIAENALTTQVLMEDAQCRRLEAVHLDNAAPKDIALLLDQEKAYDRVNINYLKQVLLQFGFPEPLVQCLYSLLVHNNVHININGFFSDQVPKQRGLKQGDPISLNLSSVLYYKIKTSMVMNLS